MLARPMRLLDVAWTKHPTIYLRLMVSTVHWQYFCQMCQLLPTNVFRHFLSLTILNYI